MGKFVALDAGFDFVGKQALKDIKAAGIKRKLIGLEIHSDPLSRLAQSWPVECDGHQVGAITSAVYSPDLDKNIAFAMVGVGCTEPGTQLLVDMGDGKTEATVSTIPFVDTQSKVWRGTKR